MATRIQRHWRGFFSRKHIHDFYKRKRFLSRICEKNCAIRKELESSYAEAVAYQRSQEQEATRQHFQKTIKDLHHLVSTSATPGIFNSPYDVVNGSVYMMDDVPLEDWLRLARRAKTVELPPLKSTPSTMNSRMSLRATPHFNSTHDCLMLEDKVDNAMIRQHHHRLFSPSIRAKEPYLHTQSIRNLEPYRNPFDPILGGRTDGFDQSAKSISVTPFRRSFASSNGLFDRSFQI